MEMSGQLHVPAALRPRKEAPVPIEYQAWGAADLARTLWSIKLIAYRFIILELKSMSLLSRAEEGRGGSSLIADLLGMMVNVDPALARHGCQVERLARVSSR
jgi:hypothetical protein